MQGDEPLDHGDLETEAAMRAEAGGSSGEPVVDRWEVVFDEMI